MKLIQPYEVESVWPQCMSRIAEALKYTLNADVELVQQWVQEGKADLWHGEKASAITAFVDANPRTLHVLCLAGEEKDDWLAAAVDSWIEYAKEHSCSAVVASGRPGWKNEFRNHGFKVTHITGIRGV